MTAALCALLREGKEEEASQRKSLNPLFMAAEINPRAAAACLLTAKANKVRRSGEGPGAAYGTPFAGWTHSPAEIA